MLFGSKLDSAIKAELKEIRGLRDMHDTAKEAPMPLNVGDDLFPVDPMMFRVGEWTNTPWPEISCFGLSMKDDEVVILCQVDKPIFMGPHHHGEWSERLIMVEGILYEHTSNETFLPGSGVFFQAPYELHKPEFKTPGRCVITWRR